MRSLILLPLAAAALLLAGCAADNLKETGISRKDAIGIAERHCPQYPDKYSYIDRAEWNPDGKFWTVAITDDPGNHGKAFKINRHGAVIDTHTIDRGGEDDYGPRHLGYWYYW